MVNFISRDYFEYLSELSAKKESFDFAIVDPPWSYNDKRPVIVNNIVPYRRWNNEEGLNHVFHLLDSRYLFLWCTNSMLVDVFKQSFSSYKYKTIITWVKKNEYGKITLWIR